MRDTLSLLLRRQEPIVVSGAGVIPWSSPVPCFGKLSSAAIATVGLNPSSREFVDLSGEELQGQSRRFHTLHSLGLARWSDAKTRHVDSIVAYCEQYFLRNPYNLWFRRLDYLLSGTRASYYGTSSRVCHLDLIPYATVPKWNSLRPLQRSALFEATGDLLGHLISDSSIKVLVLNGSSVAKHFQKMSDVCLAEKEQTKWKLPRNSTSWVKGWSYEAKVSALGGVKLGRQVLVLGFNHNVQSSYGVSTQVLQMIRKWIARKARRHVI